MQLIDYSCYLILVYNDEFEFSEPLRKSHSATLTPSSNMFISNITYFRYVYFVPDTFVYYLKCIHLYVSKGLDVCTIRLNMSLFEIRIHILSVILSKIRNDRHETYMNK